jgi:TRAP-type uncharacterized transport system substrate-binding protein
LRLNRRGWLRVAAAGGLWLALAGHSPYRQWDVYRKTRLILLTSAADPQSVLLGSALAGIYLKRLPESRATMARARDGNDLVRLLASRQLDVAVMREPDAFAALAGNAPFADSGGVRLRALAALGEHLFVCREEVPNGSAYMLIEALAAGWDELDPALLQKAPGPRPSGSLAVPLHPGAAEYYRDH